MRSSRHITAYRVYLVQAGASAFFRTMVYTVLAVYYIRTVGLNPFQLVLVGTTLEATYFLFQTPTGVIADLRSRRLSVIIGYLLVGACFLIEGAAPLFLWILAAEVIRGIGETCIDGALEAWVADEVGEDGLHRVFMRGGQVAAGANIVAPFVGAGLATVGLQLPILIGGALLVGLGLFLIAVMPETGFQPAPREEGKSIKRAVRSMVSTAGEGVTLVRSRPLLGILLGVAVVYGAHSEAFDRLWEAHLLTAFTLPRLAGLDPILWFAVINAISALIGIVVAEVVLRRVDGGSDAVAARLLLVTTAIRIGIVLTFALAGSFALAIAALWFGAAVGTVSGPIAAAWLNRQIDPRIRATVLSAYGQADALGQIGGGPAIGAVGTVSSVRIALAISGLMLTPALFLYGRALRRGRVGSAESSLVVREAEA